MKLARMIVAPALALALISSTGVSFASGIGAGQYGPGPGGWDAPPQAFREFQQRGFRDGIEGARKDYENHRRPTPDNRDEFRHPNFIPRQFRDDYRDGFRRGYDVGVRHMMGGGPGGPPPGYGPR
jgi:ribosome modulation factor